jgi:ATP-dependent Clp protease ATP-binding subunit ClpB
VDFTNTVVIMTSNIGDWENGKLVSPVPLNQLLRQHFRPEFLNRVDAIVTFHGLTMDDLAQIVDIQLERLNELLAERRMSVSLTPAAKAFLAQRGYDPAFGARPLKRVIQQLIQDPLAMQILEGKFHEGDHIQVDLDGDQLVFTAR